MLNYLRIELRTDDDRVLAIKNIPVHSSDIPAARYLATTKIEEIIKDIEYCLANPPPKPA